MWAGDEAWMLEWAALMYNVPVPEVPWTREDFVEIAGPALDRGLAGPPPLPTRAPHTDPPAVAAALRQ